MYIDKAVVVGAWGGGRRGTNHHYLPVTNCVRWVVDNTNCCKIHTAVLLLLYDYILLLFFLLSVLVLFLNTHIYIYRQLSTDLSCEYLHCCTAAIIVVAQQAAVHEYPESDAHEHDTAVTTYRQRPVSVGHSSSIKAVLLYIYIHHHHQADRQTPTGTRNHY